VPAILFYLIRCVSLILESNIKFSIRMNRVYRLAIVLIALVSIYSCSKELSYETSVIPVATTATGSLKDSLGNCLTITPSGSYYNGIAILGDTNYVQITVDVKTTGNYNIQSDRQNGFQFAGTGVFNSTGIHTISLKASGTPSQIQTTAFTVSFDSTACMFTVNVQDSTGHSGSTSGGTTDTTGIALGKWQFITNGHTYSGNIATSQFSNLIGASLTVVGSMASGSTDSLFGITIEFPASTLDTGTYVTSDAGTNFSLQKYPSGDIIYAANATSNEVVSIDIVSYNASTKVIYGTFSGQAYDSGGNTVNITNGKFKATVN